MKLNILFTTRKEQGLNWEGRLRRHRKNKKVLTVSVQNTNAWHFSRSHRGGPSATAPGDASAGLRTCPASSDAGSIMFYDQPCSSQDGLTIHYHNCSKNLWKFLWIHVVLDQHWLNKQRTIDGFRPQTHSRASHLAWFTAGASLNSSITLCLLTLLQAWHMFVAECLQERLGRQWKTLGQTRKASKGCVSYNHCTQTSAPFQMLPVLW